MAKTIMVTIEEGPRLACTAPDGLALHVGDQCIVEMERFQEFGRIDAIASAPQDAEEAMDAHVLRMATLQDQSRHQENAIRGKLALATVAARAAERDLPIRLIRGRFSFARHRFRALFSSDSPVDARELARDLSGALQTQVELQQIGVRDEAGLIGGMGPCGRSLCCCTWLKTFESINVRMAKVQKLSLNPSAITGCCGRLKCCLRYEYEQYNAMGCGLPRYGTAVDTPAGAGSVLTANVLLQRVKVRLSDGRIQEFPVDDLHAIMRPHHAPKDMTPDGENKH